MLKKLEIALITVMVLECSLLAIFDEKQRPAFMKLTSEITMSYVRWSVSERVKKKEKESQQDKR